MTFEPDALEPQPAAVAPDAVAPLAVEPQPADAPIDPPVEPPAPEPWGANGPPAWRPPDGGAPAQLPGRRLLPIFGVALVAVLGLAVVGILLSSPAEPESPCAANAIVCSNPPVRLPGGGVVSPGGPEPTIGSGAPAFVRGTVWTSADLGYQVEYDPSLWSVVRDDGTDLVLENEAGGSWVLFEGRSADAATPSRLIDDRLELLRDAVPDLATDPDAYDAVVGPHIGFIDAEGDSYIGTATDTSGLPSSPVGFAVIAATDGRISVAVTMEVDNPDRLLDDSSTRQYVLRIGGDRLLKDFRWRPRP